MKFCCEKYSVLYNQALISMEEGKTIFCECIDWGCINEIRKPEYDFEYCPYCGFRLVVGAVEPSDST